MIIETERLLLRPFRDEDREANAAIFADPDVRRLSLGPRILRAETAAIAAVGLWMGLHGDWR